MPIGDVKEVWRLAWPAVALNGLQVINSLLDTYFVGHLPKSALTAHGSALNVIFLMFSLIMTVSVASTALVSRAFGAKQEAEYKEANRRCLVLGFLFGVVMMLVGLAIVPLLPRILVPETDHVAAEQFIKFLSIFSCSLPASAIITVLAGSLRGVGDTKSPMFFSGLQILIHMILNFFLIFPSREMYGVNVPGAGMGLPGAALALAISAWLSAVIYLFFVRGTALGNSFNFEIPTKSWTNRVFNIAGPGALQAILRVLSFSVFTFLLKSAPGAENAMGALRIGIAIEAIMFMPAFGLSMAAGALVGQNLGAKKPERAHQLGWVAGHSAAIVVAILSIPTFIFAPQIADILTGGDKPGIAYQAMMYIRILIVTEILFAYAMVMIGALQGAGDTRRTTWITIASLWGLRVPLALVLIHFFGPTGAWIAMSGSQAAQGLMAMWTWNQGHWKTIKV
ncbi:MAG: MATE family efflux transporter [Armatimonadetes bacterium]|nr:MATE family efflux transporter [Armatimonadota bacterium]